MPILYKYCDQLGGLKILSSLELRLPYISEVNDPHDTWPCFHCPDDIEKLKLFPEILAKRLGEKFTGRKKEEYEKALANDQKRVFMMKDFEETFRQNLRADLTESCLISVSQTSAEPVMWAHYAENHKGIVIGFEFDNIFNHPRHRGINMQKIDYSVSRPTIDILNDPLHPDQFKRINAAVMTKSKSWEYEKEFRQTLTKEKLHEYLSFGLARKVNKSWYLKIHANSIKEVIFGLKADEGIKKAVKRLANKDIKLREVRESNEYTFEIADLPS